VPRSRRQLERNRLVDKAGKEWIDPRGPSHDIRKARAKTLMSCAPRDSHKHTLPRQRLLALVFRSESAVMLGPLSAIKQLPTWEGRQERLEKPGVTSTTATTCLLLLVFSLRTATLANKHALFSHTHTLCGLDPSLKTSLCPTVAVLFLPWLLFGALLPPSLSKTSSPFRPSSPPFLPPSPNRRPGHKYGQQANRRRSRAQSSATALLRPSWWLHCFCLRTCPTAALDQH
jgi:hypothetical protein